MLGRLKENQKIGADCFLFRIGCPEIAAEAVPGQFVEVRVSQGLEPLLRRPMSIFDAEGEDIFLLVRIVGKGTEMMSRWIPGCNVDLIGPLGNGFPPIGMVQTYILAAGGIGVAPVHFLAKKLLDKNKRVVLLYSPKRSEELLKAMTCRENISIRIAENRFAIRDTLESMLLEAEGACGIYCCGPDGFMQTVAEAGKEHSLPVFVSLEARMACGFGVCMGCVAKIRAGDDVAFLRVCKEGPVFRGEEVLFE